MRKPEPEARSLRQPAAALPEVHRPRQQPRLLRVDPGRDREHQSRALPRVVPADPLQPPSDRPGRHGAWSSPPFRDPYNYNFDPLLILGLQALRHMHERACGRRQAGRDHGVGAALFDAGGTAASAPPATSTTSSRILTETIGSPTPMRVPFVPQRQLPNRDLPYPIAPQDLALQAVDRLLDDVQPRASSTTRRGTARTCCSTSTGWGSARSSAGAATTGRRRRRGSMPWPSKMGAARRAGADAA